MANQHQPEGTHRRGVGDRPYSQYVIYSTDQDGKESQLGLTHRVRDAAGKPRWQGEVGGGSTEVVRSPLLVAHKEAVEWIVGSQPQAPEVELTPPELTEKLKETVEEAKANRAKSKVA